MNIKDLIIHEREIEAKEGIYADFPNDLNPALVAYLEENHIQHLYCHQAEMFDATKDGSNVVITTSTASGKTLSFLLPVLQEIFKNPSTRAIFMYPTKALASDQYRALEPILAYFGKNKISAGVYDGDTPVNERQRIRTSANIILTNPDMLNTAFLPNHDKFGFNFIFSNLKFLVIDELHSYRGAFGAHLANLMRRVNRVCAYYNSTPQYLCSSATINNPQELASIICGGNFKLIDHDGSPSPKKRFLFIQPPYLGKDKTVRQSSTDIATELIPELVLQNRTFIDFCKSRKAVEVVLKESRDKLSFDGIFGQDKSDKIYGYRGGYTPLERKEIERKMVDGNINGLISTNALELGIDIGKIDTTVLNGYPGTRASFWQQSGRAGRNGQTCETYLILDNLPFDQFIGLNSDWLFESGSENAVVDKDNLTIQIAHIRAASAEFPLGLDDLTLFPDLGEIIPVLLEAGELKKENGKFVWIGKNFPSGDFSMRNMDDIRYKLINESNHEVITEMDEAQAFRELHLESIYMHDSQLYQIVDFDQASKKAMGRPVGDNYYTEPDIRCDARIIKAQMSKEIGRTTSSFGDIFVADDVYGHKRLQFHNHQNLGYDELETPLSKSYETEGVWINIPDNVAEVFTHYYNIQKAETDDNISFWKTYYGGMTYALQNAAMMTTMASKSDVDGVKIANVEAEVVTQAVCLYDIFVGGLGFSEKIYQHLEEVIHNAIDLVEHCTCNDGCPACVGDYKLDKSMVLWGLKNLIEFSPAPIAVKPPILEYRPRIQKTFNFKTLVENWDQFREFIKTTGEENVSFISSVERINTINHQLELYVDNQFIKEWMEDISNKVKLKNILSHYIEMPKDVTLEIVYEQLRNEELKSKIYKRYNDIKKN